MRYAPKPCTSGGRRLGRGLWRPQQGGLEDQGGDDEARSRTDQLLAQVADAGQFADIGRAVGNEYQDNEELKGADKITKRDKHRWELDPASAEADPAAENDPA